MRVLSAVVGAVWLACVPQFTVKAAPANWAGLYFGMNAGWAGADSTWNNVASTAAFADAVPPLAVPLSERISGAVAGAQIGYNVQSGPIIAGVELLANGGWADGKQRYQSPFGAGDDVFELEIQALLVASGRVGYAWDKTLIYVKGGVAAALLTASVSDTTPLTIGSGRDRRWRLGPTLGGGVEYALTPAVSLGLEYSYVHLFDTNFELGDGSGTYLWNIDMPDLHWVAARLNFRMN
jgi:outer membrane immunogenic protein